MMAFVGGATSSSSPRSSPRQQQMNGGGDHHAQQPQHQQRQQHLQQHRQRQQKRQQQGQKGEMMDEPGDDHIIELEDDDDDDDDYDDDIDGGSGGGSYNDPIPAEKSYSDNSRRGKDNNDNSSNGFSGSNKHRSASNTGLITKTAGELRCDATNNSRNINNMNGGGMMMGGGGDQHQAAVKMSLNQKNHRMAKELSDLRVRHREETRVVSRLTMENMNLASRCREAISQVASLRKEMLVHQKRQSEYVTLQKEVEMLRKLVGNNKSSSITSVTSPSSNDRHIASITNELEQEVGGLSSPSTTNYVKQQPQISTASSTKPVSPDGEAANNRSDSPATDLDRIMSQQFRKTVRPQASSLLSPTSISSTTSTTKGGGTLINSSSSVIAAWTVSSTAASKQSRPAAVAAANKGSNNLLLTSSNVKIPISVTSAVNSSKKHSIMLTSASANTTVTSQQQQPKDDEFDADIDMVDFFAKSQSTLLSTTNINGTSKNHIGVVGGRTHHNILRNSNKSRFGTDDIMPDDVIPISNASGVIGAVTGSGGNGGGIKGKDVSSMETGVGVGDNLLSSLDAFEASFASAFPETSFAITTNDIAPLSTAKLDMSFDVPDFDPFFKSPSCVNNTIDTNNSNNIAGRSKPEMVLGVAARGGSVTGSGDCTVDGRGGSSKNIGGSSTVSTTNKSQLIHDLFPESAMNFSIAKLDNLAFDASPMMSFEPMERTTSATPLLSSSQSKRGRCNNRSNQSPLSPQSMSAEIEQLDAIADLASSISGSGGGVDGGGASMSSDMAVGAPGVNSSKANINRSSVRKVKQPVSYAEPSTKAKLRRGDVLFPKMESSDKVGKAPGGGVHMTSTTELDQIMSQIASLPSPTSSLSQSHPSSET